MTIQLVKGGLKVLEWVNVANTGQRPGFFSIKRKIPLALKSSPLVVAGIVLVILPKKDTNRLALPPSPN